MVRQGGATVTNVTTQIPNAVRRRGPAWPLAARGQGAGKVYRLCALSPATAQLESIRTIVLPELAKAGFAEGSNLVLDARAPGLEKLPETAREMVASRPDAIMGVSGAVIEQLKAATGTIPIVMSFSDYDPVGAGFVASFARPGGNITGIAMLATVLDAKRLNLLHEAVPAARRIAVLAVSDRRHAVTLASFAARPPPTASKSFRSMRRRRPPILKRSASCARPAHRRW